MANTQPAVRGVSTLAGPSVAPAVAIANLKGNITALASSITTIALSAGIPVDSMITMIISDSNAGIPPASTTTTSASLTFGSSDNPSTTTESSFSTEAVSRGKTDFKSAEGPVRTQTILATYSPTHSALSSTDSGSGLSNGTVAGIVIGVALGLSLVTFILTFFFFLRRKNHSERLHTNGKISKSKSSAPGPEPPFQSTKQIELPPLKLGSNGTAYESDLPQAADDATIKARTKTFLDQLDLHVDNFYRNRATSELGMDKAAIEAFETNDLKNPLHHLVKNSKNALPLIKRALNRSACRSISLDGPSDSSLLPTEFQVLPRTLASSSPSMGTESKSLCASSPSEMGDKDADVTSKEATRALSRWRVLTAYLRPSTSSTSSDKEQRAIRIRELSTSFSKTFAPWKNPKYSNEDAARNLSAILEEGAELGILLVSQPSEISFIWPDQTKLGARKIAVSPGLVKLTDEQGEKLSKPRVLIESETQDI